MNLPDLYVPLEDLAEGLRARAVDEQVVQQGGEGGVAGRADRDSVAVELLRHGVGRDGLPWDQAREQQPGARGGLGEQSP
ncbi:hypothetical protein AB0A05_38690 [Streptomyces sp. NPDC046374]|uniref:hypothetical protein n=1 Tax=Streptomyces sp. NPDC046374 TaxID=3154917 RepID=UPI0033FF730E